MHDWIGQERRLVCLCATKRYPSFSLTMDFFSFSSFSGSVCCCDVSFFPYVDVLVFGFLIFNFSLYCLFFYCLLQVKLLRRRQLKLLNDRLESVYYVQVCGLIR